MLVSTEATRCTISITIKLNINLYYMIVANYVTVRPTQSETYTYEDFYKFLGTKPHRLGVVSRMFPDLTASFLTDTLMNVYHNDTKKSNKFQSIDSMMFEWDIETNFIKRVFFAADVTDDGSNGSEITMAFTERYYEKYDIFKIDESRQQCIVVSRPVRKADNYWEVQVRLIDNNYDTVLDLSACKQGMSTRFQSNAHPELHEEGYVKSQSSVEHHRNYITTFRNDISYSALYKAHENTFIKIGEGDGDRMKETIYKMDNVQKTLLDNFLLSRNQGLLFNKTNINPKTGRSTIVDPDTGRPVNIGDGLVPQIERFASKYAYNGKPTRELFNTIINTLGEKADKETGNAYHFIVNSKLWQDLQDTLGDYLANFKTDGAYLYSKAANSYVAVGATYNTYNYAGNQITFTVDRALTREFGNQKGYGIAIDLTADETKNQPAIAQFTLKGGEFLTSKYLGVGGEDGLTSGLVASPVAGSKLINWGYAGIAVFNPYRSFIVREA